MPYYVSAGICFVVAIATLGMGHRLRPPAAPQANDQEVPMEPAK